MPPGPPTWFRPGASGVSPTLCTFASGPSAADIDQGKVMTTTNMPIERLQRYHDGTIVCCVPLGTGPPGAIPTCIIMARQHEVVKRLQTLDRSRHARSGLPPHNGITLRNTRHAEDLPIHALSVWLGIWHPVMLTKALQQSSISHALVRVRHVPAGHVGKRQRDSRLDVDLVHLIHVYRHSARGVQLLVALAAPPVLACRSVA